MKGYRWLRVPIPTALYARLKRLKGTTTWEEMVVRALSKVFDAQAAKAGKEKETP